MNADPRDMQNPLREEARTYALAMQDFAEDTIFSHVMISLVGLDLALMKFLAGSEVRL